MYAPLDTEGRSLSNLFQYIIKDDILELIKPESFSVFFTPFKSLIDKEIKRYEKFVKK